MVRARGTAAARAASRVRFMVVVLSGPLGGVVVVLPGNGTATFRGLVVCRRRVSTGLWCEGPWCCRCWPSIWQTLGNGPVRTPITHHADLPPFGLVSGAIRSPISETFSRRAELASVTRSVRTSHERCSGLPVGHGCAAPLAAIFPVRSSCPGRRWGWVVGADARAGRNALSREAGGLWWSPVI
jgi:hypothetical protein